MIAVVLAFLLPVTFAAHGARHRVDAVPPLLNASVQGWQQEVLDQHNVYRCMHGVPLMSWNTVIENNAQSWANHMAGQFIDNPHGGHNKENIGGFSYLGENIAWGNEPAASVDAWYDEIQQTNGGWVDHFESGTGHYTQVVWRESTSLGCGWFTGGYVDYANRYYGKNLVCQYGPGGNNNQYSSNVNGPVKSMSECQGASPTPTPTPSPSPSPSGSCTNIASDADCAYWFSQGWCDPSSEYYAYNFENCQKGCGFCGGGGSTSDVSCGAHHASTCADCPWENGQWKGSGWCNGECHWTGDACAGPGTSPSNITRVSTITDSTTIVLKPPAPQHATVV